jgi:hypothetical protein
MEGLAMTQARTRRWLRRWAGGFLGSALWLSAGLGASGVHDNRVLIQGLPGFVVQTAIAGAKKRLEHPACAGLLTEFQSSDGVPLAERLTGLSLTPPEYLSTLWFTDADNLKKCYGSAGPIAFTAPGHPVVFICGQHFVRMYGRNPRYAEILLIHEMLHAAGLGENPPTSEHISQVALLRCSAA